MFTESILFGGHFCYVLNTVVTNSIIRVMLLTYYEKGRVKSNISNTRESVSSDIQTPRRELKIRRAAKYF